jgi:DNA-binding GntR family transcriptional regulator
MVFSMLVDTRGVTGWEEHERILEAIERQDVDAAKYSTMHHMSSVLHDLAATAPDGDYTPDAEHDE